MAKNKKNIKALCEESFSTHKATLVQNTDRFLIIDWRRADGSGDYYVNYILDKKRGNLIVSGDLGDSIATWFNRLDPSEFKKWIKNDIGYYISKMQCASDLYYYEEEKIASDIKQNLSDFDIEDVLSAYEKHGSHFVDTEEELWEYIEDELSDCIYGSEFVPTEGIKNFCDELDPDYWEWLYNCGKRIHTRVYLWADGFYRACNQLGI